MCSPTCLRLNALITPLYVAVLSTLDVLSYDTLVYLTPITDTGRSPIYSGCALLHAGSEHEFPVIGGRSPIYSGCALLQKIAIIILTAVCVAVLSTLDVLSYVVIFQSKN